MTQTITQVLNNFASKLDSAIVESIERGSTPPEKLLMLRSYLYKSSGNTSSSGNEIDLSELITKAETQIDCLNEIKNLLPPTDFFTSSNLTPNFDFVSNVGAIAMGVSSVTIENIGNADGILLNKTFPTGAAISWSANGKDVLNEISYDATGTTFVITTLR